MGDREVVTQVWPGYVEEADAHLTTIAIVDQRVSAVALISVEDIVVEANTETTARDEPDGTALVTACLAKSILRMGDAGLREATFDGHDDDPHFILAMGSVVNVITDPVSLLDAWSLARRSYRSPCRHDRGWRLQPGGLVWSAALGNPPTSPADGWGRDDHPSEKSRR